MPATSRKRQVIMSNPNRDVTKRFRSMGLPVELSVKLEQAVGVRPGEKPTYVQKIQISEMIIKAVQDLVADVELDPRNKIAVEQEIHANEESRKNAAEHSVEKS